MTVSPPPTDTDRPATVVEALNEVVDWFDVLESIAQKFTLRTGRDYRPGNQMQVDIRQLAAWFEANPEQAEAAWSAVTSYKPPSWRDLAGAYPDMTGGMCSVDYVRWQRRAGPEELECEKCQQIAREWKASR